MTELITKMPIELKRKLRKFNKLVTEAAFLDMEIQEDIKKAGVPYENLVAANLEMPRTEALAYINNAECLDKEALEQSILEIEEVYLHFANLPKDEEID